MKLAFVPPRFGPGVFGGSEAVSREAAFGLAARGHDVEVITTCALDHYTWANELPEGISEENGLTVRRFPVVRHPSRPALRAQLSIQAGRIPDLDYQVSWMGFLFGVPALFEYILRAGRDYDAIIFSPYLFWTTSVCAPFVAERAVIIPCLHDETYARLGRAAAGAGQPGTGLVPVGARACPRPPARPRRPPAQCDRRRRAGALRLRPRRLYEEARAGAAVRAPCRPARRGQGPGLAARRFFRRRPGRRPRPGPGQHREGRVRTGHPCPAGAGRPGRGPRLRHRRGTQQTLSPPPPPTYRRAGWRVFPARSWSPGWRARR